jgi:hypothetical protein
MDEFTRQYIETALWSSTDNSDDSGDQPLDANYGIGDIDPKTLERMIEDCADFQKDFGELIDEGGGDYGQAGHDFWLTRNGHGAGFWDGDWPEPQAEQLTEASKDFGEYNLYVGDDGAIYGDTSGGYRYNPGYDPATRKAPSTAREVRGGRVRSPRASGGHWTVEPGRHLYFNGNPAFRLDSEGNDLRYVPHVVVDGAAHLIAELFNKNGVTPDSIYARHMGHARRRR